MIFLAPVIVKYMERTLIQRNLFMANIFCQYLSPSLYRLSALVVLIYNPQGLNVKINAPINVKPQGGGGGLPTGN